MSRRFCFLLFTMLLVCIPILAKDYPILEYEISCAGNGEYGRYLVSVSAFVNKKKDISHLVVKQCAVHGVLFKGFPGSRGCRSQKPILNDPVFEQKYKELFTDIIYNQYNIYATSVDEALNVIKVGKRYKVTAVIEVNATMLRKILETKGVIRKLGL